MLLLIVTYLIERLNRIWTSSCSSFTEFENFYNINFLNNTSQCYRTHLWNIHNFYTFHISMFFPLGDRFECAAAVFNYWCIDDTLEDMLHMRAHDDHWWIWFDGDVTCQRLNGVWKNSIAWLSIEHQNNTQQVRSTHTLCDNHSSPNFVSVQFYNFNFCGIVFSTKMLFNCFAFAIGKNLILKCARARGISEQSAKQNTIKIFTQFLYLDAVCESADSKTWLHAIG